MDYLSTLFHLQSRKIGIIVPSIVISEKHHDQIEITEHPVEVGAAIADHAYKVPSEVIMQVGFAGGGALLDFASVRTATNLLGISPKEAYEQLLSLQSDRQPFDVITGKRLYKNMLLKSIESTTDRFSENVLNATLVLREVIITSTQSVQVADKADMKLGAETSAVVNTGSVPPQPANLSLLDSSGLFNWAKGTTLSNRLGIQ